MSVAIMAHPQRKHLVPALKKRLPGATVVWDKKNDRWDTGRRAMLAYDRSAEWHLVVQDDAVLCKSFIKGVRRALKAVPDVPVSFYTGKTRPYAREINRAATEADGMGLRWVSMRGPMWGVAVALPTHYIKAMAREADTWDIPNYDMRMAEWFTKHGIDCWYSIPSLVDHRVGPDNPSLVPGRSSARGRTAHFFLGNSMAADKIDWNTEAYHMGDPAVPWIETDWSCTRCPRKSASLVDAIVHSQEHRLGPVDFMASTDHHFKKLETIWRELPETCRGTFWILGKTTWRPKTDIPLRAVRRSRASRTIGAGNFMICGAMRDLRHAGNRAAWSLDGFST